MKVGCRRFRAKYYHGSEERRTQSKTLSKHYPVSFLLENPLQFRSIGKGGAYSIPAASTKLRFRLLAVKSEATSRHAMNQNPCQNFLKAEFVAPKPLGKGGRTTEFYSVYIVQSEIDQGRFCTGKRF